MSISPLGSSLEVLQVAGSPLADGGRPGKLGSGLLPNDTSPATPESAPTVSEAQGQVGGVESARVTLSSERASIALSHVPAPVYAEVWKEGQRMAVIDSRGNVVPFNGLIAPSQMGGGGGGQELAARRVAQIAQSIGGEIRAAGQVMDAPTLAMRAKLNVAYGA